MIDRCSECDSNWLYLEQSKIHTAIKCVECGKWLGWVKKKDIPYYTKIKEFKLIHEGED